MHLWVRDIMQQNDYCDYKLNQHSGFHLLELLIAIAIISLLATLSIPLYSQYIVQERRLEAVQVLSKLAIAMEEYHVDQNSYVDATLAELHFSELIVDGYYQLAIASASVDD